MSDIADRARKWVEQPMFTRDTAADLLPGLLAEHDKLLRWKTETTEVILGLQDLGRALELPLGTRITGEGAAEIARELVAERDRLRERCDILWAEREKLRAERDRLQSGDRSRATCGCDLTGMCPPAVHIVDGHES